MPHFIFSETYLLIIWYLLIMWQETGELNVAKNKTLNMEVGFTWFFDLGHKRILFLLDSEIFW